MRIAYGVHGYGRGHAMRALAVLPALTEQHDVLVLAGSEAHDAIRPQYPVCRLPTLQYHYNRRGVISGWHTASRNVSALLDLRLRGPAVDMAAEILREFKPDVVVADSEAFTLRAAAALGIPRIGFDHFGLLVYCRLDLSFADRLRCWRDVTAYRQLFGEPERVIVSSFFSAPPRRDGVCVVGAVIREDVRQISPTSGDHLLVYLSRGEFEFTSEIEHALLGLDAPVRVYGTPRSGRTRNIEWKAFSNRGFLEDLASCRAVFATTGNQLVGEIIHFGKPILGMPIDCLEQRLNGRQIERLGIGRQIARKHVTAEAIRAFLDRADEFAGQATPDRADGHRQAVEAIERFARELTAAAQPIPETVNASSPDRRTMSAKANGVASDLKGKP